MTDQPASVPPPTGATRSRRRWWYLVPVVAVVAVLAFAGRGSGGGSDQEIGGSDVPLTTVDDRTVTLADFGGRPLVVNFFASWCAPCRAEMPALEQVHTEVADDVRFVGVSVDYDRSTWKSLVAEAGITFETVFEPRQDLLREVGGKGMPTTILVTADGRIAHVHTGALDAPALRRLVQQHLEV